MIHLQGILKIGIDVAVSLFSSTGLTAWNIAFEFPSIHIQVRNKIFVKYQELVIQFTPALTEFDIIIANTDM
ncbi:Hypothetical predicted protein [Octopus vulgaris]|uniref:Uncharacterized protein n=1 Tax=Octopus vulgaris TaxID=6645 RepID=A0AA36AN50_OCTVU|nr:Hypothetical predicted protein [Octopus vulgaris]